MEQYWRAGYTRADGTKVEGHYVKKSLSVIEKVKDAFDWPGDVTATAIPYLARGASLVILSYFLGHRAGVLLIIQVIRSKIWVGSS